VISDFFKKARISNQDSEPRSAATELSLCVTQSFAVREIFPESQSDPRRFPNLAPGPANNQRNSRKSPGACRLRLQAWWLSKTRPSLMHFYVFVFMFSVASIELFPLACCQPPSSRQNETQNQTGSFLQNTLPLSKTEIRVKT
jgi:hypothetical protein